METPKQFGFFKDLLKPNTLKHFMIMCLDARKDINRRRHLSFRVSDTLAMWERFDDDVKRTTHMFEGIIIDPSNNDNPSDHPLNFASAIKERLQTALSGIL